MRSTLRALSTSAAVLLAATLAACTAADRSDQTAAVESREDFAVRLNYGPTDEAARRPIGGEAEAVFDALDLPTPTERRLGSGAPGPDYWQQRTDYDIDVRIDTVNDVITGSATVTYHNNSPHRLDYMWIQLEQNLFNTESIGARAHSPGGVLRGRPTFDGGYTISRLAAAGRSLDFNVYDTLARVELPAPIQPGAMFTFDIGWSFPMPPYMRRMGVEEVEQGKIFELAQWFPHVCKYDDVNGWNTLPYVGSGEFYTDFGSYTVDITVPTTYVVTATGVLQNPQEVLTQRERERLARAINEDWPMYITSEAEVGTRDVPASGERTWRFAADDVRTFAFAASDAFIWDACGANVTDADGTTRRVLCQSLFPKEATSWHADHKSGGSTRVVKHSIEFYSDWLYPYPYPVMTNVNGPENGMEYPMIMFCGSRATDRGPWGVTDHEVGHTWFPMIVNTDERRYMWQDEGFNSFINIYSRAAWDNAPIDISRHQRQIIELALAENRQSLFAPPDRQWPRWIGSLNYRKTALGLAMLREYVLGHERFDTAFKAYINRWAFKHPQPADFFRTMSDAAGVDLDWFWRGWIYGTGAIDLAVTNAAAAEDGRSAYITFETPGEMPMPVRYRVTFEDGETVDRELPVEVWAKATTWRAVIDANGRRIRKVEIDPDGLLPDVNLNNNVWRR